MDNNLLLHKIKSLRNGSYFTFTKKKVFSNGITKLSQLKMRYGINYSNMSINADRQTQPLPWGVWLDGYTNQVITHKGKLYLRVTTVNPTHLDLCAEVINTIYLDSMGNEMDYAEVVRLTPAKELVSKPSTVYSIKFENIVSLDD